MPTAKSPTQALAQQIRKQKNDAFRTPATVEDCIKWGNDIISAPPAVITTLVMMAHNVTLDLVAGALDASDSGDGTAIATKEAQREVASKVVEEQITAINEEKKASGKHAKSSNIIIP